MPVREILVHVSGPGTIQDEQRYRRLAREYDTFEAGPFHRLVESEHFSAAKAEAAEFHGNTPSQDRRKALAGTPHEEDIHDTTSGKRFDDAMNQRLSPHPHKRPSEPTSTGKSGTAQKKRRLQYIHETPLAAAALESQLLTESLIPVSVPLETWDTSGTSPSQAQADAYEPDTISAIGGDALAKRADATAADPPDGHAISHTDRRQPKGQTQHPQEPQEKHARRNGCAPGASPPRLSAGLLRGESVPHRQTADRGPRKSFPRTRASAATPTSTSKTAQDTSTPFTPHPSITLPPPPNPSLTRTPTNHLTPSLSTLAEASSLEENFTRHATYHRHLPNPLERGSWTIPLSDTAWRFTCGDGSPAGEAREEMTRMIQDFVRTGQGGWGMSCAVEGEGEEMVMRVFCFAGVVGHVYLLVWVASRSLVGRVGAVWRDGGGVGVVEVGMGDRG